MKTKASSAESTNTLLFLAAAALGLVGGALLLAGAGHWRNKGQQLAVLVVAIVGITFSAVVFSYGIGKDMALRDNSLSKLSPPTQSRAG